MKNIFKIILFFFSVPLIAQDVGFSNVLDAVYPDVNKTKFPKSYTVNTAKKYDDVNINIVIYSKSKSKVKFNYVSNSFNEIVFSEVLDVPVEQNTGLDSRTERFKGNINPYVIRRAPFKIFEIIKPINSNIIEKLIYSLLI